MLSRGPATADVLGVVGLAALMKVSAGSADVAVGLIDGPVALDHPDLARQSIRELSMRTAGSAGCNEAATGHGTFVAGMLTGRRGGKAPAICPECTLLVRPIFCAGQSAGAALPTATSEEAAQAIAECVDAGARVINLSIGITQPSSGRDHGLEGALNHAASRHAIVVAAAGNQGTVGSSAITRHPWVIPVVACDSRGRPLAISNVGGSSGRRGLMAPGEAVASLGLRGQAAISGGTSVAAPFVTGAVALLCSIFPKASAAEVRLAVTDSNARRAAVVPPLLDAWAAYQRVSNRHAQG
jgi:subtilisin family serine protease